MLSYMENHTKKDNRQDPFHPNWRLDEIVDQRDRPKNGLLSAEQNF